MMLMMMMMMMTGGGVGQGLRGLRNAAATTGKSPRCMETVSVKVRDRCERVEKELFSALVLLCGSSGREGVRPLAVGGFVRDKLLGRRCADLDVCLTRLDIAETAGLLGECRRFRPIYVSARAAIAGDTATYRFDDRLNVDFSPLKTLASSSNSPAFAYSSISTAADPLVMDALLRDFTINSMVYDMAAERVEDPTGQGLDDLEEGLLRTPVSPREALQSDPIRAFRALRLASSLGLRLDDGLWREMLDKELEASAVRMVHVSRLDQELRRGFSGPDPARYARLLASSKLFKAPLACWQLDDDDLQSAPTAAAVVGLACSLLPPPHRPWTQLLAVFVCPLIQCSSPQTATRLVELLRARHFPKDALRSLDRLFRCSLLPLDISDPSQLADWLIHAGEDHWRMALCLGYAAKRQHLPLDTLSFLEARCSPLLRAGPSLDGAAMVRLFPVLQQHQALIKVALRKLLRFELTSVLSSQSLPQSQALHSFLALTIDQIVSEANQSKKATPETNELKS